MRSPWQLFIYFWKQNHCEQLVLNHTAISLFCSLVISKMQISWSQTLLENIVVWAFIGIWNADFRVVMFVVLVAQVLERDCEASSTAWQHSRWLECFFCLLRRLNTYCKNTLHTMYLPYVYIQLNTHLESRQQWQRVVRQQLCFAVLEVNQACHGKREKACLLCFQLGQSLRNISFHLGQSFRNISFLYQ